jgi:predicted Holliday junction resolvase-like endonuclease
MDAIEQQREQLLKDIQTLPAAVLQEASDFITRLRQKSAESQTAQSSEQAEESWKEKNDYHLSLQEIARLPIQKRHELLEKHIAEIAEDFANDPALTEFSELDMDDWNADYVGA